MVAVGTTMQQLPPKGLHGFHCQHTSTGPKMLCSAIPRQQAYARHIAVDRLSSASRRSFGNAHASARRILGSTALARSAAVAIAAIAGSRSETLRWKKARRLQKKFLGPAFEVGQQLGIDSAFEDGVKPAPTPSSDIRQPGRLFTIVTTAALPWRTGTAVNPTLRAAYLAKSGRRVTLMLPWLADRAQQQSLFPPGLTFEKPEEQEMHVRKWLAEDAGFTEAGVSQLSLRISWYEARYAPDIGCIFPYSDGLTRNSFPKECGFDVLILEEPEHLNWYYHGERWPSLFRHVVGIVHTNYLDYALDKEGSFGQWLVRLFSGLVCLSYVDVNVKLSDVLMEFPNEVVCNCHGVRDTFLRIGDDCHSREVVNPPCVSCYFLGKALWAKGYRNLLDLMAAKPSVEVGTAFRASWQSWRTRLNLGRQGSNRSSIKVDEIPKVDCFGSGPDRESIVVTAQSLDLCSPEVGDEPHSLPLRFFPGVDHASEELRHYRIFVNPSTSDVLCTATAEALAMGKRVVIARHPSNDFFEANFPGRVFCFEPGDGNGFLKAIKSADPLAPLEPLDKKQRELLTWESASERLFDAAEVRIVRSGVPLHLPRSIAGIAKEETEEAESKTMYSALQASSLRPSDAAQARLGYMLHYLISLDVLCDLMRTLTGAGPEKEWRERRFLQRFLKAWDQVSDARRVDESRRPLSQVFWRWQRLRRLKAMRNSRRLRARWRSWEHRYQQVRMAQWVRLRQMLSSLTGHDDEQHEEEDDPE